MCPAFDVASKVHTTAPEQLPFDKIRLFAATLRERFQQLNPKTLEAVCVITTKSLEKQRYRWIILYGVEYSMGVALSIVVLFTISSTIVRVMSVVLEHTGIPRTIARIQVLSALSGTGFTTSESEMLLETPERRQILTVLMIAGSIGLASIVATVIVGAFGVADTFNGIIKQAAVLIVALVFVRYVVFAGAVDSMICGFAYRWLHSRGFDINSYAILHRLGSESYIAEHWVKPGTFDQISKVEMGDLQLLGIREDQSQSTEIMPASADDIPDGATILALGSREAHDIFADHYGSLDARGRH